MNWFLARLLIFTGIFNVATLQRAQTETLFSFVESTRLMGRNPTYDNTDYSLFALGIELSVNQPAANLVDGIIGEINGELCQSSESISAKFEMPCNGHLLISSPSDEGYINGHFYRGERISIADNFCDSFFVSDESDLLSSNSGLSYGISLSCDAGRPFPIPETNGGYIFNVEKLFKFIYQDPNTGITHVLNNRKEGAPPFLAKMPLNLPMVKGDLFSFLGVGCESLRDCKDKLLTKVLKIVTNPTAIARLNDKNVIEKVDPVKESVQELCLKKDGCQKLDVADGKMLSPFKKIIFKNKMITIERDQCLLIFKHNVYQKGPIVFQGKNYLVKSQAMEA